jgi:predicted esterase
MIARVIAVPTHGRYLVEVPGGQASGPATRSSGPWPMLVGFHGYGEAADVQLERLRGIPEAHQWLLLSIQGLHRFYRGRSTDVIAGWMTRQDREIAIEDNVRYVAAVLDEARRDWKAGAVVFAGFSQGVSMAFRAAVHIGREAPDIAVRAVVALGGDVPPELDPGALAMIPAALIGRGAADAWYSPEMFASDGQRLRDSGVRVEAVTLSGGHEWTDEFNHLVARFLSDRR